jgi:hypothetical protein
LAFRLRKRIVIPECANPEFDESISARRIIDFEKLHIMSAVEPSIMSPIERDTHACD